MARLDRPRSPGRRSYSTAGFRCSGRVTGNPKARCTISVFVQGGLVEGGEGGGTTTIEYMVGKGGVRCVCRDNNNTVGLMRAMYK